MRKRYIFEETGEVRPPRYGEWHLVGSCDEIFMCTLDGADKPYPILTRRVEEVVCTGLSDHVRTQCPTCGEFTIIPAPPEPKAPPFAKVRVVLEYEGGNAVQLPVVGTTTPLGPPPWTVEAKVLEVSTERINEERDEKFERGTP